MANPDSKPVVETPEPVIETGELAEDFIEESMEDPDLADLVEDVRSQLLEKEPEPEPVIEPPPEKKPEEQGIVLEKPLELEDIFTSEPAATPAPFIEPEPEPVEEVVAKEEPEEDYFDWPEPLEEKPYVAPWQRAAPEKSAPWEYKPDDEDKPKEPASWEILPTTKPEAKKENQGGSGRALRWTLVLLLILVAVAVVLFTGGQPISEPIVAVVTDAPTEVPIEPTATADEAVPTPVPVAVVTGCAQIGGLRIRQEPTAETGIAGGMNFEQCLPFDAISADGLWLRTQEGNEEGVVGWVALEFLAVDGDVEESAGWSSLAYRNITAVVFYGWPMKLRGGGQQTSTAIECLS